MNDIPIIKNYCYLSIQEIILLYNIGFYGT